MKIELQYIFFKVESSFCSPLHKLNLLFIMLIHF